MYTIKNKNMKTLKFLLFLTFLIVINSCEKDNKTPTETEDLTQYEIFDVHVQKYSDKSPMVNHDLCFFKTTWHQNGRSYKDSFFNTLKTNLNGDVQFKILKKLIFDSSQIFYYIGSTLYDTSYNGRYSGGILVYHGERTNNKIIEVTPNCRLYINSDNPVWQNLKIDSIIIFNKNYYSRNLYNEWQKVEFEADCSEVNSIKYYYYSNGVKSKEFTKDIYVPFSSQDLDIVTCTLDFK
jgi:hypothetical protein